MQLANVVSFNSVGSTLFESTRTIFAQKVCFDYIFAFQSASGKHARYGTADGNVTIKVLWFVRPKVAEIPFKAVVLCQCCIKIIQLYKKRRTIIIRVLKVA